MTTLPTSAFYERASSQISSLRARAEGYQTQISTGERLERSSQDPVAAARLRLLGRRERLDEVTRHNSDRASSELAFADNGLSSTANLLARARELATQAANATMSDTDRAAIGEEVAQLQENLLSIANSRNGAGHALFGGEATGLAYERQADGSIAYIGTGSASLVDLGDGQEVSQGLAGPEAFAFDHQGNPTDLFAVIGTLADALKATGGDPVTASRDALSALDSGLERVTTAQTVIGARMNWVDQLSERREAAGQLVDAEQADLGGADIAETITKLQHTMTVLEASQASFVRLSGLTLFDMLR
ncbi:MAG: flagellar biosynthesis protein FlgL [Sphingomonadaceae bacterium]|nr:flagellar biosynthesis protein FlgL [Sphingomonadaceae bacterium]